MMSNAQFHIPSLHPGQKYQTDVGTYAQLEIEGNTIIEELTGTIRGKNNTISIGGDSHIKGLNLTIDGDNNIVRLNPGVYIDNCIISMAGYIYGGNFRGDNNILRIDLESSLSDTRIECYGTHNKLFVGARAFIAQKSELYLHGFGCSIRIGDKTSMTNAFIHAEEIESIIEIGEDNMLAAYVAISTSDKHPIYSIDDFRRKNEARSIVTGKHVWMASGVQCLKGAAVGDCCIIGKHTSITKPILDPASGKLAHHVVIHGNPAKVHQKGVTWSRDMFFDLDDGLSMKYPDAAAQTWFNRGHILVRQGNEYFIEGLLDEAQKCYNQGIQAYESALNYKDDFVYAYCALGIAYIRHAQVALDNKKIDVAINRFKGALSNLANALMLDAYYNDSVFCKQMVQQALESAERYCKLDHNEFDALKEMAFIHLKMCSIEWYLFDRELARHQYEMLQTYIIEASKKGSMPDYILRDQSEIIRRYTDTVGEEIS